MEREEKGETKDKKNSSRGEKQANERAREGRGESGEVVNDLRMGKEGNGSVQVEKKMKRN